MTTTIQKQEPKEKEQQYTPREISCLLHNPLLKALVKIIVGAMIEASKYEDTQALQKAMNEFCALRQIIDLLKKLSNMDDFEHTYYGYDISKPSIALNMGV